MHTMKTTRVLWKVGFGLILTGGPWANGQDSGMATTERRFRDLPMEARRLTGPLFWMHGDETPEQLEFISKRSLEGGNGTFTAESRPHKDWLGEGWYRDLAICLDFARKNNLTMIIFDDGGGRAR